MFGLIVSEPTENSLLRNQIASLLEKQMIPLQGFTVEEAAFFPPSLLLYAFLRRAAAALLMPGTPLPAHTLAAFLSQGNAMPGNVLRRYVLMQLSLLPAIRYDHQVSFFANGHLLGQNLFCVHVNDLDAADSALPPGVWTDLFTDEVYEGQIRQIRTLNAMPVLVRDHTLLPIGLHDRETDADDAAGVTLHWFRPSPGASTALSIGPFSYSVQMQQDGKITALSNADKPWHLIVHCDAQERLIR